MIDSNDMFFIANSVLSEVGLFVSDSSYVESLNEEIIEREISEWQDKIDEFNKFLDDGNCDWEFTNHKKSDYLINAMKTFLKDNNISFGKITRDSNSITFDYISGDISYNIMEDFELEFNCRCDGYNRNEDKLTEVDFIFE